jgi:AcrR family transcriptional regulator
VSGPTPPNPRRADARANRDAVLRAAAHLFAERGLDVPFEEIARTAGVGRATLYRHFPTRDDLLLGILERSVRELEALADSLPAGPDALLRLFEGALRQQVDNLPLVDLLPPRSALPPAVRPLRTRIEKLFRAPLAAAQEAGVVHAELTVQDVRILLSMLTAIVRPETPRVELRRAWQLALAAMGAGAASDSPD